MLDGALALATLNGLAGLLGALRWLRSETSTSFWIAVRVGQVEATTEELRTAMIQYRTIFDELVQTKKPVEIRTAA